LDEERRHGDPNDISSVQPTLEAFFGTVNVPPTGSPYYNYGGALRCMSEGNGDVAFVKDSTVNDFCGKEEVPEWCLPVDGYRMLPSFGKVPSHPTMVGPHVGPETRAQLLDALLALNDSEEGRGILKDVLNTPGIVAVETEEHLGSYTSTIQHVPGLANYYGESRKIEA
jgi:ABC-type phosphate/phosphonate transport system substrate-binding protein